MCSNPASLNGSSITDELFLQLKDCPLKGSVRQIEFVFNFFGAGSGFLQLTLLSGILDELGAVGGFSLLFRFLLLGGRAPAFRDVGLDRHPVDGWV